MRYQPIDHNHPPVSPNNQKPATPLKVILFSTLLAGVVQ
jgi:hypothetical protein